MYRNCKTKNNWTQFNDELTRLVELDEILDNPTCLIFYNVNYKIK